MKKRLLSLILCLCMVVGLSSAMLPAASAAAIGSDVFTNSSWFGQYTGQTNGVPVERYMDFTIDQCDRSGEFSGSAKITTVEGQGHDSEWFNYQMSGKIDFSAQTFHMQGTKITASDSGSTNWTMIPFDGTIRVDQNGDIRISGIADNDNSRIFSVARTSAWARDEMTEANILGLIPPTLKGSDMTRRVTRAEFTAVAVQLYETLIGRKATAARTNFTDIAGNANKESIEKAYALGFTAGTSNSTFSPNDEITREQLATMLCRVIKKYAYPEWTLATDSGYTMDISGVPTFADDADISAFAKPSVYFMTKWGIVKGVDSTHFAPKNTTTQQAATGYASATREQAVVLSLRVYNLLQSVG